MKLLVQHGRLLNRARLIWAVVAIALCCTAGTAFGACGDYLAHPGGAGSDPAMSQFDLFKTPVRESCHGKQCGQNHVPISPTHQQRLTPPTHKYATLSSQSMPLGSGLNWLLGIPPADGCGSQVCSRILRPPKV